MNRPSDTRVARVFALLLLLAVVGCALAGCSNENNKPAVTTKPVTEDNGKTYPNYDGKEFRIMFRSSYAYEFRADEGNTGDRINDAVYTRNELIQTRYNVTFRNLIYNHSWKYATLDTEFTDTLANWMNVGEDAVDLIAGYHRYVLPTVANDWYLDWQDIPGIDLKADTWQNGINETLTIGGNTYAITGDIALTFWKMMSSMVFNKQLAIALDAGNLYDLVTAGDWTLEKMMELSSKLGTSDGGAARYGFASDSDVAIDAFVTSFGVRTVNISEDGVATIDVVNDRSLKVTDRLIALYSSEYSYKDHKTENDPSKEYFTAGNVLFNAMRFEMIERLRKLEFDYGVLPYPKLDSDQKEYCSSVTDGVSLMFVPKTVPNTELVGTITQALAEESRTSVRPEYIELVLKGNAARDAQTMAMIDLIRDTIMVDPGYILNGRIGLAIRNVVRTNIGLGDKQTGLRSYWEGHSEAAKASLDKFIAAYTK